MKCPNCLCEFKHTINETKRAKRKEAILLMCTSEIQAEKAYRRFRKQIGKIGRTTFFNYIDQLNEKGLLKKIFKKTDLGRSKLYIKTRGK